MGDVAGAIWGGPGVAISGHVDNANSTVRAFLGGEEIGVLDVPAAGSFSGVVELGELTPEQRESLYLMVFDAGISDEAHYPAPAWPQTALAVAWDDCGGLNGLGYPHSYEEASGNGTSQSFDRGTISASADGSLSFAVLSNHRVVIESAMEGNRLVGVRGGNVEDEALVDIYHGPAQSHQEWMLNKIDDFGIWEVRSAKDPRFLLGVSQALPQLEGSGYQVDVYQSGGGSERWQQWNLTPDGSPGTLESAFDWPGGSASQPVLGIPGSKNNDTQQLDVYPVGNPAPSNQLWTVHYQ
jgi:hypothetical protein